MEYNNPAGLLHKPPPNTHNHSRNHNHHQADFSHVAKQPRKTLRRAPSAPVRSRYRDASGGHVRRGTLPDLNLADSQIDKHVLNNAASTNDLHRLSEASGELFAPPNLTELRPDSLAIFSSSTLASLSPHPTPPQNPKPIQVPNPSRPPPVSRAQTTGRLSLRHTLSTRGLKRPSIIGVMDGSNASPRSHNGSSTTDGTSSPRQRYSDEIKIKKKNGLGSFMAGLMKSNSRPAISAPANPLHVVHVGVDSTTGEFTVRTTPLTFLFPSIPPLP